jgi:vitamin B12 transporter
LVLRYLKFILFLCEVLCVCSYAYGQGYNTLKNIDLEEVTISSPRIAYSKVGNHVQEVDTLNLLQNRSANLGQLLSEQSSVQIRTYGALGSQSSISMRGTGSNHTSVMWNGFPMNSLTTGQTDLSLIPALSADRISVIPGAPSSLFGSGTFGGSVEMSNKANWNDHLDFTLSNQAGSFDTYANAGKLTYGNGKISYAGSLFDQRSRNNYYYESEGSKITLNHNHFDNTGTIHNFAWKISNNSQLETGAWYQQKHKQIPLLKDQSGQSTQYQADSSLRFYGAFTQRFEHAVLYLRSGYFNDFLHYTETGINSHIRSSQWMNQAEYKLYLTQLLTLDFTGAYDRQVGKTDNYTSTITENNWMLSVSANYNLNWAIVNASLRKDWMALYSPKPQYGFGIHIPLIENMLTFRGSASTRFRKPTFNERYWQPYGNPDIKAESGWGCESGLDAKYTFGPKIEAATSLTVYSNSIDNWIQWIPIGGADMEPVNYRDVWARGIEADQSATWHFGRGWMRIKTGYQYTRSTIEHTYDSDNTSKGTQLIYVPLHTLNVSWTIVYNNFDSKFDTRYTSYRYYSELNGPYFLPGYTLVNWSVGYTIKMGDYSTRIDFQVLNLTNIQYETVRSYPMPTRSFMAGLVFSFK